MTNSGHKLTAGPDGSPFGAALDWALDLAVVPGYTSLGFRLRRRWWQEIPRSALEGRAILVTGASSGIGEALCARLVRCGARVRMLVRNAEKGEAARRRVIDGVAGGGAAEVALCDVSDLDDVRRFAATLDEGATQLDGLVHNAGVLNGARERSPQGFELTFATAVLGPFLLTRLLQPHLRRGSRPAVVTVSSGGMYTARAQLDDLQLEGRSFDGPRFYAHAKRLQVLLTAEWARRERGSGVSYSSLHPGWVDTPGLEASLPGFRRLVRPFLRDPDQGADTALWLLAAEEPRRFGGAFWHDRRRRPTHLLPWTREEAGAGPRLWRELVELSGDAAERNSLEPRGTATR